MVDYDAVRRASYAQGGPEMTAPRERAIALELAYTLMRDLCDSSVTPRVPLVIRRRSRAILKHYPSPIDIEMLCERAPEVMSRKF